MLLDVCGARNCNNVSEFWWLMIKTTGMCIVLYLSVWTVLQSDDVLCWWLQSTRSKTHLNRPMWGCGQIYLETRDVRTWVREVSAKNTIVMSSLISICYENAPLTGVGGRNISQNLQEEKQQFSLDVYVCVWEWEVKLFSTCHSAFHRSRRKSKWFGDRALVLICRAVVSNLMYLH